MNPSPHELDGPALIKAGRTMGDVTEFYGVFLQGRLLMGNDGPHRFATYGQAMSFHEDLMAPSQPGKLSENVRRR